MATQPKQERTLNEALYHAWQKRRYQACALRIRQMIEPSSGANGVQLEPAHLRDLAQILLDAAGDSR